MTVKKLIGQAPSQAPRNRDLGSMAYQDVSLVKGPAFSAYLNTGTGISANVSTKVPFNTEEFDTNNNFDSTTNYRFTPTVAGYYQVSTCVGMGQGGTMVDATNYTIFIYKNGATAKSAFGANAGGANDVYASGAALIYMNGTTDYLEVYAFCSRALNLNGGSYATYFQAFLARPA